jgi:hypothetical protein
MYNMLFSKNACFKPLAFQNNLLVIPIRSIAALDAKEVAIKNVYQREYWADY